MKRSFIYLSIVGAALALMAFQCSSAELTGAKLYLNQKQFAKAEEALLKEVAKNPKSDEGWFILGYQIYGEHKNDYVKMIDAFEKSLAASPKFAKEIDQAKKYYWASAFNRGVGYFNNAAKASTPDSMKTIFAKAADMFNSAALCQPDSVINYTNLAMVYINTGDYASAIAPLETAVKLGKSSEAYSLLGQIYLENANKAKEEKNDSEFNTTIEKAITVLDAGRQKFPDNGEILLRYSNALIAANKMDVAMAAFKTGVEKEPENKFYRYNYGVVLLNSGNFAEAETQFKKAIELDDKYSNAIYNLGVTYVRWGTSFREAAEKKGESVDENIVREKFTLAYPHIKSYLEMNPKEPALWELLGKIYANLNMKKESDDAFKKADEVR
ncbi:MAG: tetratricopeptide domain-containing protein [Ignavibacteria bacterium]|nr:MAG: tetratricopeptide domain-containing protein [Ignavibacteria bacterium]KAF0161184.1 MAG: tetratricopeptide domain-containing protein [Ignavibacteria bacterium]